MTLQTRILAEEVQDRVWNLVSEIDQSASNHELLTLATSLRNLKKTMKNKYYKDSGETRSALESGCEK